MASALQRLARKSLNTRFFDALHTQAAPKVAVPIIHKTHVLDSKPVEQSASHLSSFLDLTMKENSIHSEFSRFYPSFPFGFYFRPVLQIGSTASEAGDAGLDNSGMIWADSVKKKRKKKMNKHKYKKLRKRLRRQT